MERLSTMTLRDIHTACGISPVVELVIESYAMGGIALQLWDHEGPLLTATLWIPGIPEGCVAIKDFDENEGILDQLIRQKVVDAPHVFLDGLPICRLQLQ